VKLEGFADVKELGLRFNLVSLLPTGSLVLFVLALRASGAPGQAPDLQEAFAALKSLSGGQLVALFVFVLIVSLLLHPLQISLVRLLEGYWGDSALGRTLSAIGIEVHRRRQARLQNLIRQTPMTTHDQRRRQSAISQLRSAYPPKLQRLLPTRLGNALRAAEDRAGQRYGLLTVTILPRLYPYLSERFAAAFADLRNQLDVAVRLCVMLLLATLISALMLIGYGWWLVLPVATGTLSWISYRAAVRAALNYGQGLHVAFDLHRFDLLRALHYPLPPNLAMERAFNRKLSDFFDRQLGMDQQPYQHIPPPETYGQPGSSDR
jgi:hypothetical protein